MTNPSNPGNGRWLTLGDALAYGLSNGVNNFISSNNTFEQQRQQQANTVFDQQFRTAQAAEQQREWELQQAAQVARDAEQRRQWEAQQAAQAARDAEGVRQFNVNADRLVGLDNAQAAREAATLRFETMQKVHAPGMNAFMQNLDLQAAMYAPTVNGQPNPTGDPAMYNSIQTMRKQAEKLWNNVTLSVSSGQGYDDAVKALHSFLGNGEEGAPQAAQPTPQAAPQLMPQGLSTSQPTAAPATPIQSINQPMTVQGDDGASVTFTPEAPQQTQAPAAPAGTGKLPKYIQDIKPSDLLQLSDADVAQTYGQWGLDYARAARAQYSKQLQDQADKAAGIRAKSWDTQLSELSKRTDLTGDQRLAMATISSLMAKPNLTADDQELMGHAFQLLTPKMYDATTWQKLLDTKDPATILAQLPVYQKYAPDVVAGFDPKLYQQVVDDTHNKAVADVLNTGADTTLKGAQTAKTAADTTKVNNDVLMDTNLFPYKTQEYDDKHRTAVSGAANIDADTKLKGLQGNYVVAQTAGQKADTALTLQDLAGKKVDEATKLLGVFATFPPDLTYAQAAKANPQMVSRLKSLLGMNDEGLANLWRQAQYKYSQGLRGDELANQLKTTEIANNNATRGETVARTGDITSQTRERDTLLPGKLSCI